MIGLEDNDPSNIEITDEAAQAALIDGTSPDAQEGVSYDVAMLNRCKCNIFLTSLQMQWYRKDNKLIKFWE